MFLFPPGVYHSLLTVYPCPTCEVSGALKYRLIQALSIGVVVLDEVFQFLVQHFITSAPREKHSEHIKYIMFN